MTKRREVERKLVDRALAIVMREAGLPKDFIEWAIRDGAIWDAIIDFLQEYEEEEKTKGARVFQEAQYDL